MSKDLESSVKKTRLFNTIKKFSQGFVQAMNHKATEQLAYEAAEMEHAFSLMLFGSFTGMPSPPMPLALELLPVMEDELEKILLRASQTGNGLSELASIMGEP